jgi:O-antigen/teichoic acid export membrane protein
MSFLGGFLMFGVLLAIAASRTALDPSTRMTAGIALGAMAFATTHGLLASSIARGLSRFALMEVPPLLVVVGRLSVVIVLTLLARADLRSVLIGYGLVAIVCMFIAQFVVSSLTGGRGGWLQPSIAAGKRLFAITLPYAMAGMGVLVIAWADVLVLGFVHPAEEVARYEPVLRLTDRLMLLVPNLFAGSFLPVATRMYERDPIEAFDAMFRLISRYVYSLSVPFLILLIAFPETVISTMYGSDFPVRPSLVWVLLVGYVINLVTGMNYLAISATGDRKMVIQPALVAAGAMIILAFTLIPPFGPMGAALATSLSFLILNILVSVALIAKTGVHPFDRQLFKVLGTSLLPIAAAIALRRHGYGDDIWTALGISGGLFALWVGLLALTRSLDLDLFRKLPRGGDDLSAG